MERFYININRQFGSLGRPIAMKLAEILELEYYDRDIVERTARHMNLTIAQASDRDEVVHSAFAHMALPLGEGSSSSQDKMFGVQSRIIRDLAEKGSAIFVGRCADYVLQNRKCFNVYIYAPKEQRYLNCVNTLGMSPMEAKKMIAKVDKARDRYWMRYTKHLPSDPEFNHVMIDSSMFGITGTAEILADMIRKQFIEE